MLPAGHTLIDVLLLAAWMWHAAVLLKHVQAERTQPRLLTSVALLQEGIPWEPLYVPPPPKFVLLASGTLPAGIVSTTVRPGTWKQRRIWDPLWLLIHEAVAIPLWFVIGMLIDTGRVHLGKVMSIYMAARFGFGILDAVFGLAQFFTLLQFLFWLWLTGYGFVHGVSWFARKMGLRTGVREVPASPKT